MRRLINFILNLLAKENHEILELEKQSHVFWINLLDQRKIKENIVYFLPYQNYSVKMAILEIKTRNNQRLLKLISNIVAENLMEELAEWQIWHNFNPKIVIPIPASNKVKGFNHSEEIAKSILKQNLLGDLKIEKNILFKSKPTSIQHSLSREKRLKNLKNSMSVKNPGKIAGKDILLIDDIVTTGATFDEAVRALKKAGARKVFCVALAH